MLVHILTTGTLFDSKSPFDTFTFVGKPRRIQRSNSSANPTRTQYYFSTKLARTWRNIDLAVFCKYIFRFFYFIFPLKYDLTCPFICPQDRPVREILMTHPQGGETFVQALDKGKGNLPKMRQILVGALCEHYNSA